MKKFKLGILGFILVAAMTLVAVAAFVVPQADAGHWAEVCCGSGCVEDYCIGSGSYTCCKGGALDY